MPSGTDAEITVPQCDEFEFESDEFRCAESAVAVGVTTWDSMHSPHIQFVCADHLLTLADGLDLTTRAVAWRSFNSKYIHHAQPQPGNR